MRVFDAEEYRPTPVTVTHDEARLLGNAPKAQLTVTPGDQGQWIVTPSSMVGVVTAGDVQVHVRPKIGIRNVLRLLDGSATSARWLEEEFSFSSESDLLTAIIEVFTRALDRALAQGLRRDYLVVEEDLVAVRGRIDMRAAMRRGPTTTLPCRYEEYSPNIPVNGLLLAAAQRSLRVPGLPIQVRRSLHHHLPAFEGVVAPADPLVWLSNWTPTRLDRHLEPAVRLGALILRHLTIADAAGGHAASTFLLDMNSLVESFLTERLRTELAGDVDVVAQMPLHLDEGERVHIKPDLVFLRQGRPVFVADVKYKAVSTVGQVSQDDLYQLHAYATVLGLSAGALITCGGDTASDQITVRRHGTSLEVWPIDLTGSREQLDDEIHRLATLVRRSAFAEAR